MGSPDYGVSVLASIRRLLLLSVTGLLLAFTQPSRLSMGLVYLPFLAMAFLRGFGSFFACFGVSFVMVVFSTLE